MKSAIWPPSSVEVQEKTDGKAVRKPLCSNQATENSRLLDRAMSKVVFVQDVHFMFPTPMTLRAKAEKRASLGIHTFFCVVYQCISYVT